MTHWIDSLTAGLFPRFTLKRQRARIAGELLQRHYEAASAGRRTQGWNRGSGDANTATFPAISRVREVARDLVRNNCYAAAALNTITDHAVGWGIVATTANRRAADLWKAWADTSACDADGRNNLAGLQKMVMRAVVESGEVLVRRRFRLPEDRLPIPLQLQVIEPDYLDTFKNEQTRTGQIIQGVEFNPIGKRIAYWLFRDHPGNSLPGSISAGSMFSNSERVPASEILHIYKSERPGQVRGVSWLAPIVLKLKDFDEYEDAALMKQKIAACLAIVTSDVDGTAPPLGTADDTNKPGVDSLEPGLILNIAPGRQVSVVQPPTIREHADYAKTVLQAIAVGLGLTYEDLTGSYENLPYSAARMSRLRHWARVEDWRWRMLIPQFCDPVWSWAMTAAAIVAPVSPTAQAEWTAPPMPLLDPDKEGLALSRLVRIGGLTWPEMVRERGYDPEKVLVEISEWNKKFDAKGVILDCDPRKMSAQGQPTETEPETEPARPAPESNGNGDGDRRLERLISGGYG